MNLCSILFSRLAIAGIVIGVLLGLALLGGLIAAAIWWRAKNNGPEMA
jgi:hypothetical protein